MARIDSFLAVITEQNASDLHFCAGTRPTVRHDGELVRIPFREISPIEARRFLYEILTEDQRRRFERDKELDFVYRIPNVGRFRANYFEQSHGLGAVFRVIPDRVPTLSELDMPPGVRRLAHQRDGLVLITGPTGSGKTTTLAALLHEINQTDSRHIVTIEDPIEFIHEPIQSVVTQRQVGTHTGSFASALRSAMREAPDVVVVGEMRDAETVGLALSAAETGTLVLGTLHTNTAPTAIDRIVEVTEEDLRPQVRTALSVLLRGVVSQQLIKRAAGEGRIAAVEVLLQSVAVANMIREDKIHQLDALLESAGAEGQGNMGLDRCLVSYVRQELIRPGDALRVAKNPQSVRQAIEDTGAELGPPDEETTAPAAAS